MKVLILVILLILFSCKKEDKDLGYSQNKQKYNDLVQCMLAHHSRFYDKHYVNGEEFFKDSICDVKDFYPIFLKENLYGISMDCDSTISFMQDYDLGILMTESRVLKYHPYKHKEFDMPTHWTFIDTIDVNWCLYKLEHSIAN